MAKALFTTTATVQGGRAGKITSEDGNLTLNLSLPKDMGGPGGEGTNPEQLFAAGYAACFQSALGVIARRERIDAGASTITGTVSLYPNGKGGFQLGVELAVTIPGVEREAGERMLELAHEVCPYSNAIRGNVDVKLTLVDAE